MVGMIMDAVLMLLLVAAVGYGVKLERKLSAFVQTATASLLGNTTGVTADKAAQATLLGSVFDDAATGQGLLNFFLRGMSSGVFTPEDVPATGLTTEELQTRSFVRILKMRRGEA